MNFALDPQFRPHDSVPADRSMVSFTLALVVHGLLFALLWTGVAWKSSVPQTVEAELWSALPQIAAPAPAPPPPTVDPEPAPQPKPAPVVETRPQPAPVPTPDIALERLREQKRQKLETEQREQAERDQQRKADASKKAQDQKKLEQIRQAEQQRLLKEAARDKEAQDRHDRQVASMLAAAGTPGNGSAAQSSGPRGSSTYISRVSQMIRGNTTYTADSADINPSVEFLVRLDPAGGIMTLTKAHASGSPAFDDAVERAIRKTEPYPPDGTSVPSELRIVQRLKQ
jgi:colicin import membrane protein